MKWFIGVSSAIMLGALGWVWSFILMTYQASADVNALQVANYQIRSDSSDMKAELRAVKEISLRTEANTEKIREFLLRRALPIDAQK